MNENNANICSFSVVIVFNDYCKHYAFLIYRWLERKAVQHGIVALHFFATPHQIEVNSTINPTKSYLYPKAIHHQHRSNNPFSMNFPNAYGIFVFFFFLCLTVVLGLGAMRNGHYTFVATKITIASLERRYIFD